MGWGGGGNIHREGKDYGPASLGMEALTAYWAPRGPNGGSQTTMRPVSPPGQIKMAAYWQLTSEIT